MLPVIIFAESLTGHSQTNYFKQDNDDAFFEVQTNVNYITEPFDIHLLYQYQNEDPPTNFFRKVYDSDQFSGKINTAFDNNILTIGNFYESIGHGIILRAQKDDVVLTDQNIYGLRWSGSNNAIDYKLFRGDVRNANGIRPATTSGIQTIGYLTDEIGIGFGASSIRLPDTNHDGRTLLISLDNTVLQLNGEFAQLNQTGFGNYINADISFDQWVHHIEYAKYSNMSIVSNRLELSQGPMAINDSEFSLPNKLLPTLTMSNHDAHTFQTSYHSLNDWIVEFSFSEETSGTYKESAVFYETESFHSISTPKLGYSNQEIIGLNYHTWMLKSNIPILWDQSIDIRNEYQSIETTNYYTYLSEFTLLANDGLSIGYLYEEQNKFAYHKNWQSFIINYQPKKNHFFQFYIGESAAGVICSGGVCIIQPEFSGIKVNWNYSF